MSVPGGKSPGLSARDVRKSFRIGKRGVAEALAGVSFDAPGGTLAALVGPDGAGKTTLLRLLAGLMKADAGAVTVLGIDAAAGEIQFAHTDELLRQQLRMWVRVPVLIPGRMHRIIGPEGIPHPSQDFEVTLLDLSGGGAMVSSTQQLEIESRGLLDFMLGDAYLEGVRFVMLRTGKTTRSGGHVCHLCFENIDVQTQERIMRYVFERQRAGRIGT